MTWGPTSTRRCFAAATTFALLALGACSSSDDAAEPTDGGTATTASTGGSALPTAGELLDVASLTKATGTDGRVYLADADGRALQLRGFNIKTQDPLADVTDQALTDANERGFNLLRLSVYWHLFEPEQGQFDEAYLADIDTALDRAAAHGITVIVSFHQDIFGPAFGDAGIPEWATRTDGASFTKQDLWLLNYLEPAVQNAWEHLYEDDDLRVAQATAWTTVAERVADHPSVIGYDLLNEPFGKFREGEPITESVRRVQAEQLTPMYQRLIDAMRPIDPDAWMFVEAPNVASIGAPISLGPLDDDKVVFFPHLYDPNIETANYTEGKAELDLSFFEMYEPLITTYATDNDLPLMIGEWGLGAPDKPGMDQFVAESIALMDRIGSGWTMFTWCRGESYCPIDAEGNDRPNIGQIVQPWARAIAGAPTSFGYDPESHVLRIVFDDNDATGTTDLYLAEDIAYPDGYVITTSDADGEWSSIYDAATGIASVTTPESDGTHAICVSPEASPAPCEI